MTAYTPKPFAGAGSRALTRGLLAMAEQRARPRCAEWGGHELWTSDDDADREQARRWCAGCPVLGLCLDAAVEEGETWSVRGGVDFRNPNTRRAASRLRDNPKEKTP